MTTSYLDVSSASQLDADIEAADLASQADGGNGMHYLITLQAGATLTENADISAINLAGADTLTAIGGRSLPGFLGGYESQFAPPLPGPTNVGFAFDSRLHPASTAETFRRDGKTRRDELRRGIRPRAWLSVSIITPVELGFAG